MHCGRVGRNSLVQYGAVERKGVRHRYGGMLRGEPSGAETIMPGTETRADAGLRIVFVRTLYAQTHQIYSAGAMNDLLPLDRVLRAVETFGPSIEEIVHNRERI